MLRKPWKVITSPESTGSIEIYGNHHVRNILYAWNLTPKELAEFDYLESPEEDGDSFFRYKGDVYHLGDIPRIEKHCPQWMQEFDGIVNDSFFSGILVKYAELDYGDYGVKVYTFIIGG